MKRLSPLIVLFSLMLTALPANAIDPPSRKPLPTYKSTVLNRADAERLENGLAAARRSDWLIVRSYRNAISDPAASKLLLWREASTGMNSAGFAELDQTLRNLKDWPAMASVRENAEEKIVSAGMSPAQRASWLEQSGPISGEGKLVLADAYIALGRQSDAHALIKDAWKNHTFSRSRQREIAGKYGSILNTEDHIARTEYLLWNSQRTSASDMKSYLPSDYSRLVDARITLAVGGNGVDTKINAVPSSLQANAGLLFERSYWRRKRGRWEDARELLLEIKPDNVPDQGLSRIWKEKNLHVRRAIKDREYSVAYRLASVNGMSEGVDFAEAEFLAGWLALRYLNRPEDALRHFQTLEKGVGTPISKSRGLYWTGEALTALRRTSEAQTAYQNAAQHMTSFYGQRAAEKSGNPNISLPAQIMPLPDKLAAFEQRELIKALKMLAEAGEDYQFRRISYHLDDQLETPLEYAMLFDVASRYGLVQAGVRGAKAGMNKNIIESGSAYPLLGFSMPLDRNQSAEPALVMAIARQESELNPRAISHANAYGLLQMLSSTASMQARREGMPFRRSWLLDDPEYNAKLGRAHLSDLIDDFNGSYILAIAGYNAGASRPRQWVKDYGDPRRGEIDPIDFIESIPFSETRNYVQRVLENTQVYRQRLSGQTTRLQLEADLRRGR